MKKVKVLMLSQYLSGGGLERMVQSLALELKQSGSAEPILFSYEQHSDISSLSPLAAAGIPVIISPKRPGFSLRNVIKIIFVCLRYRVRLVHAHDLGPLIYGAFARLFTLGYLRLVHTQHCELTLGNNLTHQRYFKWFSIFANEQVAVSLPVKKSYEALGVNFSKGQVIENGIPALRAPRSLDERHERRASLLASISPELRDQLAGSRWLLALGRVSAQKGHGRLLEIWANLPANAKAGWILVIVGQEQEPGFLARNQNAACADVVAVGATAQPESWLASADCFVSASLSEGMPLSPIEALAHNLPVMLSDIPGHQFLQKWAVYFPLQADSEAILIFAKRLSEITSSKNIPATDEEVLAVFSLSAMADRYLKLYRRSQ